MENPERVTYFAATDSRGKRVPFGIKAKDRARHMYVIGKTGMGKSTLLENMAIQDIRNGEGMAFIDPHGSAVEKLLDFIPENRIKDVVYFAPFDLEQPMAFNVMEDVGYDKRHLVVSGLMATFKKIWEDAWSARMEYILTNTLLALLEYPDATLLGVNRMYTDKGYRKKVVDNVKDPVVKDFWTKEFANYGDRYTQEATPAIQNKIGQFTGNPLIRNIIGQSTSSFDIRTLMDERKILLINLSKGLVGDTNMQLLGSMLTTRIFLAAMSRANLPAHELAKAPNFYFYVDEFQNFANQTFSEILSEARKYHLNLLLAHQYVAQMEEEVQAAVFGNVGTTVSFRVGPLDAELLEKVFTPEFLQEDLVNLGFAQVYLSLMIDGIGSRPFSGVTIPPIEAPQNSYRAEVIQHSRTVFGTSRQLIEDKVQTEYSEVHEQAPKVEPKQKAPVRQAPRSTERAP
ncbi:type IV secretion system DNA-binding domain-containing protein, partial [Patescibacteria group bacterium]|nr:type IV secretion system DNA-binding domain-containing protein [Patescibacteria group bacterium]